MADALAKEGQISSESAAREDGKTEVELWLLKIEAAKEEEKTWRDSANRASDTYEAGSGEKHDIQSAFNIYHSNVEVRVPALYNSTPVSDVRRRYEPEMPDPPEMPPIDENAPPEAQQQAQAIMGQFEQRRRQVMQQARQYKRVADITERCLAYSVDQYDFNGTMEYVVRDSEVTGRGVPRIRYTPIVEGESITDQSVRAELVTWDRFIRGPGLLWEKVPFVAFAHDLSRDEIRLLMRGENDADKRLEDLGFGGLSSEGTDSESENDRRSKAKGVLKTIPGYEIWSRGEKREVLFITPHDKERPLLVVDDPLGLANFFPVPKPLQAVWRLRSLTPVCPYDIYRTQIEEMDDLTRRIRALVKELKVRGLYDPKYAPDFEALKDCEDGEYIPAGTSEEFVKGANHGLADAVHHWPLETILTVLQGLYEARESVKKTIYEIMGVSDILRGTVDPREKLGQSEIKAQAGSQRLKRGQDRVAAVAREIYRMKAEIMHRLFTAEQLSLMSGLEVGPEEMRIMRTQMRSYSIDIETDSTVRADVGRRQEELNMFLQGTAQIVQAAAAMAPVMPFAVAALLEVFISFARQFNLGKAGEDALDKLGEAAKQPPAPQDDGSEAAAAAEAAKQDEREWALALEDRKDQREAQRHEREIASYEQKARWDFQMQDLTFAIKQIDLRRSEIELQKAGIGLAGQEQKVAADADAREEDRIDRAVAREQDVTDRDDAREAAHEDRELDRQDRVETMADKRELAGIAAQAAKQKASQRPSNGKATR
jgi:hypothetical protein